MSQIAIKIEQGATNKRLLVEMDADRLERLASDFGLYNPAFVQSLEKAERDYRAGRVHRIASLRSLRGHA